MRKQSGINPVIVSARHFVVPASQGLESSYRMIRLLGRGTMASVYLAEQISMERPVALKILSPALATDKSFVERFLREARASARLNHPNIVTAIDFGEIDNRFYLAMEFVDGDPLSTLIEREGSLDESRVIGIGLQVVSALRHADEHHVVHLDVKPANIMIRKDGRVKLTDFGLAVVMDAPGMAEASRKAVGTPYYMAPEQVEGGKLDWRTDQYSLGASLYEAVTGRKPFQGNSVSDILVKRFFENPEPAWKVAKRKVPRGFSSILSKMLSRSPEGRYQSFDELEADLSLVREGKKPAVAKMSQGGAAWNSLGYGTVIERMDSMAWKRQRNWLIYASAAFFVILLVYGAVNARVLMGPRLPVVVRGAKVAEAKNLPADEYRPAREIWRKALESLARAENIGSLESMRSALGEFRKLSENRNMQNTVYYPAAKQNVAYIEQAIGRLEMEAVLQPRSGRRGAKPGDTP